MTDIWCPLIYREKKDQKFLLNIFLIVNEVKIWKKALNKINNLYISGFSFLFGVDIITNYFFVQKHNFLDFCLVKTGIEEKIHLESSI